MIDDTCNFLGVSFQDSHNLFRVFVKDYCILVIASSDNAGGVSKTQIQSQNTRNASTVNSLSLIQLIQISDSRNRTVFPVSQLDRLHKDTAILVNNPKI